MGKIVIHPAVNAVLFNEEGKVLLTRRSAHIREPGKWCLPGGHLEKGEPWEVALVREVKEETGLEVRQMRLVGVYSDPGLTLTAPLGEEGHQIQFVCALYKVDSFAGEVLPNDEVDAWDWFDSENLPSPLIRSHPIRIYDAIKFKGELCLK
jgi:8-oxo-dGTP pyrophosphatase MutT (NUDIX family)